MEYLITYPDDVTEVVDIEPNNLSEAIAVDSRWLRTSEGLDINLHNVRTIEQASASETAARPRVSWDDWRVGDQIINPMKGDLPIGVVLVDLYGEAWKLNEDGWTCTDPIMDIPLKTWGPYTIVGLPGGRPHDAA